jgi:hypothetical protein
MQLKTIKNISLSLATANCDLLGTQALAEQTNGEDWQFDTAVLLSSAPLSLLSTKCGRFLSAIFTR